MVLSGDPLFITELMAVNTHTLTDGDLVRWYVTAADTDGRDSRGPLFTDQTGRKQSAEYLGTVIADTSVATNLPYLMWFLKPGTEGAAQSRTGTRTRIRSNWSTSLIGPSI